ncbi:phospholipid-transporting ATPase IB-like isoform X2 [Styela clava]
MMNFIGKTWNRLTGYGEAEDSSTDSSHMAERRVLYVRSDFQEKKFCGNKISTGKYNFLTFLPRFLFEQFRRAANIFFLIIVILQQIPDVSPTGRFTTIVPLTFILLVAAIKEIVEDYKRHRADDNVNNRKILIFRDGEWRAMKWTKVVVGDVVKVINGQFFPADLILMSSSEPQAMCYIETANLDGETNLKIRQGVQQTGNITTSEELNNFNGKVECEAPNRHLYEFNGNLQIENERPIAIGGDQILLRGAMLRNTQWVFGIVVYTGHDTKLMMNANRAPLKMSNVDKTTNMQIWFLMIILIVISLTSAIGSEIWKKTSKIESWYLPDDAHGARHFFMELLTFIILYNNLVPISLLVTLEVVKFIQAIFINSDIEMYDPESNTPAMARTSNLNEELGQIKYIFSDKTGTLTRNVMLFRKCTVAGVKYGDNNKGTSDMDYSDDIVDESREEENEDSQFAFNDPELLKNLHNGKQSGTAIRHFLTLMSVCHTVVPEKDRRPNTPSGVQYQSSSPDESALVKAAQKLGFEFTERTPQTVTVDVLGTKETYDVLNVLEFTSTRKRMSVIVRTPNGKIRLMCKGADNVIYERLAKDSEYTDSTTKHLEEYACEGLRTLCFAYTDLDPTEYEEWKETCYQASIAINDREQRLEEAYELIEKKLHLVGASAIEDKLQEGVPDTISKLSKAEIKIWVLTGDKQETAINIGYSCHLLTDSMSLVILDKNGLDATRQTIRSELANIGTDNIRKENNIGLVVSGSTLKHALACDTQSDFLDLALSCKAVICCRVSPMQKAEVVELVKKHCEAITLAIGDGANDVSMIQAAHVGVGISGQEGLQAANSSDYSIAQFRFLKRLLLVHGAWNYNRLAKCILFSFYKNICLYLIEFWFAFVNGFSGQILFERWTIALYNVFFTALPPFSLGLFERTCSSTSMMKHPALYSISQRAVKYNARVFWTMFLNSVIHSLLLFFLPLLMLTQDIAFIKGWTGGYLFLGNFVYTYVVITVSLKAALESNTWTVFTHVAIWGSILFWFVFFGVYSHFYPVFPIASEMLGQADMVLSCPLFWIGLLLLPLTVLMRDLLWKVLRRTLRKTIVEEVQELERKHFNPRMNILEQARYSLTEKAHLLRNMFGTHLRREGSQSSAESHELPSTSRDDRYISPQHSHHHGFAFSQEERGVVTQSQLIRSYDSTADKPLGK